MRNKLQVIREQPFRRLQREFETVIKSRPHLAFGADIIARPLLLLRELALTAVPAIDNQLAAVERMRMVLLHGAAEMFELRQTVGKTFERKEDSPGSLTGLYDLVLLNFGALVPLGFAAVRVGQFFGGAKTYLDVLEASAIASLPAQSLVRSLNSGLDEDGLVAVLSLRGTYDPRVSTALSILLDPCEKAAYRCIGEIFKAVWREAAKVGSASPRAGREREWDGATSVPIERVERGDSILRLHLQPGVKEEEATSYKRAIFASATTPHGNAIESEVKLDPGVPPYVVVAPVPPEARAGRVGLQTDEMRQRLLADRNQMRKCFDDLKTQLECLQSSPIPPVFCEEPFSDIQALPRTAPAAAWGAGILDVTFSQDSEPLLQGRKTTVSVALSRPGWATDVKLLWTDQGETRPGPTFRLLDNALLATAEVPGSEVGAQLTGMVQSFSRSKVDPDDEMPFVEEFAATDETAADTDLRGRQAGNLPDGSPGTTIGKLREIGVVLIRPAFIEETRTAAQRRRVRRVSYAEALNAFKEAREALRGKGYAPTNVPLPWLADAELVVDGMISDFALAAATVLLQRLDAMAALTVSEQSYIWVALVPYPSGAEGGKEGCCAPYRVAPGGAARALVVCHPSALDAALVAGLEDKHGGNGSIESLPRLRLIGTLPGRLTEPPRLEKRSAGPGAGFLAEAIVTGHLSDGTPVLNERLRTANPSRQGPFALLLPVDDHVQSVEFQARPSLFAVELRAIPRAVAAVITNIDDRAERYGLDSGIESRELGTPRPIPITVPRSVHRPSGQPSVAISALDNTVIAWTCGHSRGVRAAIEIELGVEGVWRRVLIADDGAVQTRFDFTRLGPSLRYDSLRIVASDGWTMVAAIVKQKELASKKFRLDGQHFYIRTCAGLSFWIDSDRDYIPAVRWQVYDPATNKELGDEILPIDAVFELDPRFRGTRLKATAVPLAEPALAAAAESVETVGLSDEIAVLG